MDRKFEEIILGQFKLAGFRMDGLYKPLLPRIFRDNTGAELKFDFVSGHYQHGITAMETLLHIEHYVAQARPHDRALIYIHAKEVNIDLAEAMMRTYQKMYIGERVARWSAECLRGIRQTRENGNGTFTFRYIGQFCYTIQYSDCTNHYYRPNQQVPISVAM
jgi:hypothetical protein